ncbi:MAG: HNH endonuclease [Nitrosopumilus sp.]|nr:HNH endonuclease [Nitrosopumilus sp.]
MDLKITTVQSWSNVKNNTRSSIPSALRHEVFKNANYKCQECGNTKDNTILEIDHIRPVSQGGSNELDNLQCLCKECNMAKKNRNWKSGEKDD